jgi:hypothetical protein
VLSCHLPFAILSYIFFIFFIFEMQSAILYHPHHAVGLFNPNPMKKWLLILDTPDHVDSENIKLKIGFRSSAYQLFSKRDLNS